MYFDISKVRPISGGYRDITNGNLTLKITPTSGQTMPADFNGNLILDLSKQPLRVTVPLNWPTGTYTVTEAIAPAGYIKTNSVYQITIDQENRIIIWNSRDGTPINKVLYADTVGTTIEKLQIINQAKTLPSTGGIGSIIFKITGLIMMLLAVLSEKLRKKCLVKTQSVFKNKKNIFSRRGKKMKLLRKVMALVLVFMMTIAALPTLTAKAAGTTKIILTKIVMSSSNLSTFTEPTNADGSRVYDGTQLSNIESYFGKGATTATGVYFTIKNDKGQYVDNNGVPVPDQTKPYYFITDINGQIEAILPDGTYTIDENKALSTYTGPNGEQLTSSKAIPMTITLPYTSPDGTFFSTDKPLYLYPKNGQDKPTVDKKAPNYDGESTVGDVVPYQVSSFIPADSSLQTLVWNDIMSKGLTFNPESMTVNMDVNGEKTALAKGIDYTLLSGPQGFTLSLTAAGLTKVNNATKQTNAVVNIYLNYNATLNDEAVVNISEKNTISLVYDNNPDSYRNSTPFTPTGTSITVTKNWKNADGSDYTPAVGSFATFDVVDGTGKVVNTITLDGVVDAIETAPWVGTITGLTAGSSYTLVERNSLGFVPTFTVDANGNVTAVNAPSSSSIVGKTVTTVTTYGANFKKVDQTSKAALAGAEFVVTNSEGSYLILKDTITQTTEISNYNTAEKNYQDAIAANNAARKIGKAEPNTPEQLDALKNTRNAAYIAMNTQWTWGTDVAAAFKFKSDHNGLFSVNGLDKGTYKLVEVKAPAGYVLNTTPTSFGVDETTGGTATPKEVNNTKVTIPQTGGIGTVIFTVVGLGVMALALVAMKKRSASEEE